jgi:hypothetical protein
MNIWCKVSVIAAAALVDGSYGMTQAAAQGSASPPAQSAPSPGALQAARDLTAVVSASMISELSQNLATQIWPGVEAALRSRNPNISAAALSDLRREFERQSSAAALDTVNDAVGIYARHFTIEEMHAMAAFYRTPAGAKALKVMPQVTVEFMTAMAPRMQVLQTKVAETVVKLLENDVSASAPARPAATK